MPGNDALTIADLGASLLRAGLVLTLWGLVASVLAAARRDLALLRSARLAAAFVVLLVLGASLAMVGALVTHDFSIRYVALNNARETPLFWSVISLWGALEGSILLWALVLAGATAWVAWRGTAELPRLGTVALSVLLAMLAFFLLLMVTPAADPFAPAVPVPENGRGPNPLLQDHWLMALHPPLLYLGYVLFSIPFAYAIAALVLGEAGDRWLVVTRRSALASWALLGVGLAAGAWWGYSVLGWGGYWAWDPVENAALMPWLTATAYLHSVMVEEKRRMLRLWNVTLVIATFALTILGTFLTRSGVVNSVHSFTQSAIGPLLLGYLAAILVLSVALVIWRSPLLRDGGPVGPPLSREAIFLFQNVIFVGATLTVLLGTLYPLVAEALSGRQLSIGAPYFDRLGIPLALALLFLMGVGPQLPWHGASRASLERQFTAPLLASALVSAIAALLGVPGPGAVLTYALAAFVTVTIVQEFARGIRARSALHGEGPLGAFANLFRRSGRRYGGYVVHLGVILVAIGIAASQTGTIEVERTVRPGDAFAVGRYSIELIGLGEREEPRRRQIVAELRVRDGRSSDTLAPALTFYPYATQPIGSPAIGAGLDEDVYGIIAAFDGRSAAWATIRIRVVPLVSWIWVGAVVVGLGALLAGLPSDRRRSVASPSRSVAVGAE